MARTKGATNKKSGNNDSNTTSEPTEKKKRGRQKGDPAPEREPAIIVELSDKYRVKIDKWNKTLQEKSKLKEVENTDEENDNEDGWKVLGYYQKWENIYSKLVDELTKQRAKKNVINTFQQYYDYFVKATKDANKMFAPLDEVMMKNK